VLAGAVWRSPELQERLAGGLAATGLLLVALCERITLVDRMNTLFKIYNGVWYALAVALALLLASRLRSTRRLAALTVLPLVVIAAANLPIAVWQGWAYPRVESPRPTLDGRAYLRPHDQQSWRVIRALEAMAGPYDVVAEAAGASYSDFTRVAMHTGLSTVVGWEFHLIQRGQSQAEIRARFDDLERLYRLPGTPEAREVLDRLDVRWIVVVTDLERRTYGMAAGDLFASAPGLLRVVDHEGAQLYRVMPPGQPLAAPVTPLGPEVTVLGRLALPSAAAVRSLTLGPRGAVVTVDDGSIAIADGAGQLGRTVKPPPCPVLGAVDGERGVRALCRDGRLYRREQGRWVDAGRAPATAGLAGSPEFHVWGFSGLYREVRDGGWIRLVPGPVTAAAPSTEGLAWFDGTTLVVSDRRGAERTVTPPSGGVAHLALLHGDVWALDDRGRLLRSGGGVLPWRGVLPPAVRAAAVAGDGTRLVVVLDDALLAAWQTETCASPWEPGAGDRRGGLQEPRGTR
jgi:hypothetical protein